MKRHVFMMPHPPVLLEGIGDGREQQAKETLRGMHELAKKAAQLKPEVILFVSPHGISFSNGTCLLFEQRLKGDFSSFGYAEIAYEKEADLNLTEKIYDAFEEDGLVAVLMDKSIAKKYNVDVRLDHGVLVPMSFIDMYHTDYKVVHLSPGFTSLEENYHLGRCIGKVLDAYPLNVLMVCSGDMSHALSDQGPYAYNPKGPWFDDLLRRSIEAKETMPLLDLTQKDLEEAGQCGLRSFLIGLGVMDGHDYDAKVISYEGPFGVGYMTALLSQGEDSKPSLMDQLRNREELNYFSRLEREDDYIALARKAVEQYVRTGTRLPETYAQSHFSENFIHQCRSQRHGVFVSIHKDGKLRGCMGTIAPTRRDISEEIIYNAIMACSEDPRFAPVKPEELTKLEIKVDVLMDAQPIASEAELEVSRYGVIVEKSGRRGLLLPNLEGVDSVSQQVEIAMQKAGISEKVGMKLYRFEVERHENEN